MSFIRRLKTELERPREDRPFGSGWLSGGGALLAGLTAAAILAVMYFPGLFSTPDLSKVVTQAHLQLLLQVVLLVGYAFALLSLLLSRDKILGWTALFMIVIVSLIGTPDDGSTLTAPLYFGLDFFILNVVFLGFLFVPLERYFPQDQNQTVFRPEWQEDMFYYLVSSLMVQVLTFLTLMPSNLITGYFNMSGIQEWIFALPFVVQLFLIILFSDFVQYWVHRLFHTVPALWRFHAVHHSAKKLDWLAGSRMHFIEIAILRGFTAIPMFTLGFDPAAIQAYVLIVYFYSHFIHSNIGWNLKPIESTFATPRFHHWHHGAEREAIDVNYAIHFPILDRLFGTYHMPEGRWPQRYGVAGEQVPRGFVKQFLHPFTKKKVPEAE
ncbi:Sterol desaturase/sphingolipid hydroxylase, fatty acid hydroxylase superfamily [Litoreibacter ascidiaceicola]|uniref:Sterol desaturase/sphingolipid hydroxylase, fatty acid hydroxylase superfamily n=1 Tax=Litoreibacter ascidiaceicola TaxID=1486859 RepID=A0A1M4SDT1_9RHOB|nr:sterol desaturase family protein [Litoreibacter ascidiaceicola]SHE30370.1 Sterol desaturase/sphingolipid hydroxylase, fatty acid hydroxylase superfamily [Litoreibacter ascidiaceicola]